MYSRIKYLRKELLHLTQQKFADSLKLSRANIGNIEIGRINITDRVISNICDKFHVNEKWIRTGKGKVFIELDNREKTSKLAALLLTEEENSFRTKLLYTFANLSVNELDVIKEIMLKIIKD